jgi:ABC transporter substrate binding protein
VSYGPDRSDLYRRAADLDDKILRGTKPADIPVEQPTKFRLVVNLKTAKALGLTIPESFAPPPLTHSRSRDRLFDHFVGAHKTEIGSPQSRGGFGHGLQRVELNRFDTALDRRLLQVMADEVEAGGLRRPSR